MGDPWVYSPKLGTAKSQGGLLTVTPDAQVDIGCVGTPKGLTRLLRRNRL